MIERNFKEVVIKKIKRGLNKTSAFMLPSIDLSNEKSSLSVLERYGFINCYIDHKQSIYKDESYLYMLFNPDEKGIKNFHIMYDILLTYSNYVTDYILDYGVIVVVFKVKNKWLETYRNFKKSRYSEMSKDYAEYFRNITVNGKSVTSYQYMVIHKHKDYREFLEKELDVKIDSSAELMSILKEEKEVIDYELFKI